MSSRRRYTQEFKREAGIALTHPSVETGQNP